MYRCYVSVLPLAPYHLTLYDYAYATAIKRIRLYYEYRPQTQKEGGTSKR